MLNRHHRLALLACTAAIFALPIPPVLAQSAPTETAAEGNANTTVLKKIVAKGDRLAGAQRGGIADTPLATEIDAKTLEEKQVTDLDDLGRSVDAGINASRADFGINLRGLSGPRIVTTIDGVPIPYISNSARQGAFASINANGGGDMFDFNSLSSGRHSARGGFEPWRFRHARGRRGAAHARARGCHIRRKGLGRDLQVHL